MTHRWDNIWGGRGALCARCYSNIEKEKGLWILKVYKISLDLVSNKSTVEKKSSYLSLSSAEKTSFLDLSEYSIVCNTKLISYCQAAVILHEMVLKLVSVSVKSSWLLPDSRLSQRICFSSPSHSQNRMMSDIRDPWKHVLVSCNGVTNNKKNVKNYYEGFDHLANGECMDGLDRKIKAV